VQTGTDYGTYLANEASPLYTSTIVDRCTQKLVEDWNAMRCQVSAVLQLYSACVKWALWLGRPDSTPPSGLTVGTRSTSAVLQRLCDLATVAWPARHKAACRPDCQHTGGEGAIHVGIFASNSSGIAHKKKGDSQGLFCRKANPDC
jgi:hypothetical protein